MNMGRIEQIKRDFEIFDGMTSTENQAWLLSRLQIAEEQLSKIKDKAQIFSSHCAVQMDRRGNVGSSYAFEKTQEIYEMLDKALEQIQKE